MEVDADFKRRNSLIYRQEERDFRFLCHVCPCYTAVSHCFSENQKAGGANFLGSHEEGGRSQNSRIGSQL